MAYSASISNHNLITITKVTAALNNANSNDIIYTVPNGLWFYMHIFLARLLNGTFGSGNTTFTYGYQASNYNNFGTTAILNTYFGSTRPSPAILRDDPTTSIVSPGTIIRVKNNNTSVANGTNLVFEISIIGHLFTAFK